MTDVEALLKHSEELSKEGDNDAAEDILRRAIEEEPDSLELKTMLAIILTRKASDDEAEILLRDVLNKEPTYEKAVCALGRLLDSCLRTDEAESLYREVLTQTPQSHELVDDLCRLLIDENRSDEAYEIANQHASDYATKYHAYNAIRFVLQSLENTYLFEMEESTNHGENSEKLLLNLLEQFETIMTIESTVGIESLKEDGHYQDLLEETVRVFSEIEYLNDKLGSLGYKLGSDITKRVHSAMKVGHKKRALYYI